MAGFLFLLQQSISALLSPDGRLDCDESSEGPKPYTLTSSRGLPTYSHSHAEEDWRHTAKPRLDARDGIHGPPNSVAEGRSRKEGGEDEAPTESCMLSIRITH